MTVDLLWSHSVKYLTEQDFFNTESFRSPGNVQILQQSLPKSNITSIGFKKPSIKTIDQLICKIHEQSPGDLRIPDLGKP